MGRFVRIGGRRHRRHLRPGALERRARRGHLQRTVGRAAVGRSRAALRWRHRRDQRRRRPASHRASVQRGRRRCADVHGLGSARSGRVAHLHGKLRGAADGGVPGFVGETEGDYVGRLFASAGGLQPQRQRDRAGEHQRPGCRDGSRTSTIELPRLLGPVKVGPATINAGLTAPFTVSLPNRATRLPDLSRSWTASTDAGDDHQPHAAGHGDCRARRARLRSRRRSRSAARPEPMTDVVALTWQDRNGNVYGPLSASYTRRPSRRPPGGLPVGAGGDRHHRRDRRSASRWSSTALDPVRQPRAGCGRALRGHGRQPADRRRHHRRRRQGDVHYAGTTMGDDTVVASATITTTLITLAPIPVQWAIGGRHAVHGPDDAARHHAGGRRLGVDGARAARSARRKLEAAQAAGDRFIDDLTYPRDQVGVLTFRAASSSPRRSRSFRPTRPAAKRRSTRQSTGASSASTEFCPGRIGRRAAR